MTGMAFAFFVSDYVLPVGLIIMVVLFIYLFANEAIKSHQSKAPVLAAEPLEDILAQILVLHDRLEAIAHGSRVDRDRVGAAVGKLVE